MMVSNWFNILKIKNSSGEKIIVKDIEDWMKRFRTQLRPYVLSEYMSEKRPDMSIRDTEATKINIKYYRNESPLRVNASFRDKNNTQSYDMDFRFIEEGDGMYFLSATSDNLGPSLQMGNNFNEVDDPYDLLLEIVDRISSFFVSDLNTQSLGIGSIDEEEGRKTQQQINRELAEANPGEIMYEGQMRNLSELTRIASRKGISLDYLLEEIGVDVNDLLPSKPITPPKPKIETPKRVKRGRTVPALRRRKNPK